MTKYIHTLRQRAPEYTIVKAERAGAVVMYQCDMSGRVIRRLGRVFPKKEPPGLSARGDQQKP